MTLTLSRVKNLACHDSGVETCGREEAQEVLKAAQAWLTLLEHRKTEYTSEQYEDSFQRSQLHFWESSTEWSD